MRMPWAPRPWRAASSADRGRQFLARPATGSTWTTTSAPGRTAPHGRLAWSAMSCACSKRRRLADGQGHVGENLRPAAAERGPGSTSSTPGTAAAAAATCSCSSGGTRSNRSSTDFLPSRRLTQITIAPRPGRPRRRPCSATTDSEWLAGHTAASPSNTTADDQMSVEKCRASASSAWLSILPGGPPQAARAREIDRHREHHHAGRPRG